MAFRGTCYFIKLQKFEKHNALGEYEKNNTPGEGEKNNRSKELDETVTATLVLQVLSILEKEIAGALEDPKFITKLLRTKFRC